MAARMSLRTPDDVRRLFSALGDEMRHEASGMGLSVAQIDELALEGSLEDFDWPALGLSFLVAAATGYTAIRGFQRNDDSMWWGLGWGALGFLFPVPATVFTAVQEARAA